MYIVMYSSISDLIIGLLYGFFVLLVLLEYYFEYTEKENI